MFLVTFSIVYIEVKLAHKVRSTNDSVLFKDDPNKDGGDEATSGLVLLDVNPDVHR